MNKTDIIDSLISLFVRLNHGTNIYICPLSGIVSVKGRYIVYSDEFTKFITAAITHTNTPPALPRLGQVYYSDMVTPFMPAQSVNAQSDSNSTTDIESYEEIHHIHTASCECVSDMASMLPDDVPSNVNGLHETQQGLYISVASENADLVSPLASPLAGPSAGPSAGPLASPTAGPPVAAPTQMFKMLSPDYNRPRIPMRGMHEMREEPTEAPFINVVDQLQMYSKVDGNNYTIHFNGVDYKLKLDKLPALAATVLSNEGAKLHINRDNESRHAIVKNKKFIFHKAGNYYFVNDEYFKETYGGFFEICLFAFVAEAPNSYAKPIGVNIGELTYDATEQRITIKVGEDYERVYCYDKTIIDADFNAAVEDFPISLLISNRIYKCFLTKQETGTYQFVDSDFKPVNVELTISARLIKSRPVPIDQIFKFENAAASSAEYIKTRNLVRKPPQEAEDMPLAEDEFKNYAMGHMNICTEQIANLYEAPQGIDIARAVEKSKRSRQNYLERVQQLQHKMTELFTKTDEHYSAN